MNGTRRRQWLVGAFSLSGLTFLVDQFTGGEPVPTGALASSANVAARPAQSGGAGSGPAAAGATPPIVLPDRKELAQLADRLLGKHASRDPIDGLLPARDPFSLGTKRKPEPEPPLPDVSVAASEARAADSAPAPAPQPPQPSFSDQHALEGVIIGRVRMAWIDGARVKIGSVVDGMIVTRIERDFVELQRGDERAVLRLMPRTSQHP